MEIVIASGGMNMGRDSLLLLLGNVLLMVVLTALSRRAAPSMRLVNLLGSVLILAVVNAIAIPSILSAAKSGCETKGPGALKAINTAQATYHRKHKSYASSLNALVLDGGLDTGIADNADDYSGYVIFLTHPKPGQVDGKCYGAAATPSVPGDSGDLSFYTNAKSTLWKQDLGGTTEQSQNPEFPTDGQNPDSKWSVAGQ